MVSFELGKENEKDVFRLVTSMVQIKKFQSPHEESNLSPSESALRNSQQLSHRDSKVRKARYEVHI